MEQNLPVMLKAAVELMGHRPSLIPMVSHYDPDLLNLARREAELHGLPIEILQGGMRGLARAARLCLVGSGTATLEVALSKTPMVVLYRTSAMTYRLAPWLLTVPFICQVNLMAGRELVPELLLRNEDPKPVLERAQPLLEQGTPREDMIQNLEAFHHRFHRPGALTKAAQHILKIFGP
jgi:lipid-A-disaccharide synthase